MRFFPTDGYSPALLPWMVRFALEGQLKLCALFRIDYYSFGCILIDDVINLTYMLAYVAEISRLEEEKIFENCKDALCTHYFD